MYNKQTRTITIVLFILFCSFFSFSQTPSLEEQLEFAAPFFYKDNKLILSDSAHLKIIDDILIDSLNPVKFHHTFNKLEADSFLNNTSTEFKLKFVDAPIRGTNRNFQTIVISLEYDEKYILLPLKEIKLEKYNLTDKFGNPLYLKGDSIFRQNGGITFEEGKTADRHILKNIGEIPYDSVQGFLELELDFISEYEIKKINKNDSIVVFKDQVLNILTFEDNYMKFKGKGTVINFLEFINLNDDNFRISGFDRDTTSRSKTDTSTPGIATSTVSIHPDSLNYSSSGSKLPERWINQRIDTMDLSEYKIFLKQQILKESENKDYLDQDFYYRLDFNTRIQNLFLFMPTKNTKIIKRIVINHSVENIYDRFSPH